MDRTRRSVLLGAAGAAASLAGCLGVLGGGTDTETLAPAGGGSIPGDTDTGTGVGTRTPATSLGEHPAAAAIGAQPTVGELSRPAVIVAFEDPSCPRCKRFESTTLPKIRSRLVDQGKAAFVWRGYPVVYQWGKPATQALEAAFDRSPPAFWRLQAYYYRDQDDLSSKNVYDRTESFLAEKTDLDAGAVVGDVKGGVFDDAVRTDLDAGESAGADITPSFFLFRDGEFRTKVSGPQGYEVFASALGF